MFKIVLVTLVYWICYAFDPYIAGFQCFNRPLIVGPLVGFVLGDFQTGIIMGASLEAIFLGISAIGGSAAADCLSSTVLTVAFTIMTGTSMEAGLALALPIGTLMASLQSLEYSLWGVTAPHWEKLAVENEKRFEMEMWIFAIFVYPLINTIAIFSVLAFGVDGFSNLMSNLPAWVMSGFAAASGMLVAVGFAILTSMIWSKELGIFLFVGYVLAKLMGLSAIGVAIIAAAIAVAMYFSEKRIIDLKTEFKAQPAEIGQSAANDEEDFF